MPDTKTPYEEEIPTTGREIAPDSKIPPSPEVVAHAARMKEGATPDAKALRNQESSTPTGGTDTTGTLSTREGVAQKLGTGYTPTDIGGPVTMRGMAAKLAGILTAPKNRKKVVIASGTTAGVLTLVVGAFSMLSGPAEFVQLSHLLERFHFSAMEDTEDGRMTRLARYIRDPANPQNTRLGLVSNKVADRFEKKMNKSGIVSQYTEVGGYGDGYTVDRNSGKYKNTPIDEIKNDLKKNYGLDDSDLEIVSEKDTGKQTVKIKAESLNYRKSVALQYNLLRDAGLGRMSSAVGTRQLTKRADLTWHPIKKADQKIVQKAGESWKDYRKRQKEAKKEAEKSWRKRMVQYVRGGNSAVQVSSKKQVPPDENGNPNAIKEADADEAEKGTTQASTEANEANAATGEGDVDSQTKFSDKISVKIAGGGVAAIGVMCMVKGLSDNISNLRMVQVVLPMMRMGMDAMSIGSQVMSGQDIDMETLGIATQDLHRVNSAGKETSWNQARSIQAESGEPATGPDIPDSAKVFNESNPLSFVNEIPNIRRICSAAESTIGQGISLLFSGGPLGAASGYLTSKFVVGPVLQQIAAWIAGDAINPLPSGVDRGNFMNYGARLAANEQAVMAGGESLSGSEEVALQSTSNNVRDKDFESKSFAYRMFNNEDPQSLVAQLMRGKNPSENNVASMTSNFASIFGAALKAPAALLPKAHAGASTYDYGFPAYGFPISEQNNKLVENPYQNAKRAADILDADTNNTFKDRAKKCFGVEISEQDGVWDVTPTGDQPTNLYGGGYPTDECSDSSAKWLTIRFFILDTNTMKNYACFEGEDDVCSEIGVDTGGGASPSVSISGDVQELAQQIVDAGNLSGSSEYMKQIQDLADGKGDCPVDPLILKMLVGVTVEDNHKLTMSSLNRKCTGVLTASGEASYHYASGGGHAIDVIGIDGLPVTGYGDTGTLKYLNSASKYLPKNTGYGQVESCGSSFKIPAGSYAVPDECSHQHIQVPYKGSN